MMTMKERTNERRERGRLPTSTPHSTTTTTNLHKVHRRKTAFGDIKGKFRGEQAARSMTSASSILRLCLREVARKHFLTSDSFSFGQLSSTSPLFSYVNKARTPLRFDILNIESLEPSGRPPDIGSSTTTSGCYWGKQ